MSDATEAEIARAEKRGVEKARKVVADKLAREEARLREHENPITSPMLRNYLGGLWVAIEALDRAGLLVDGEQSGSFSPTGPTSPTSTHSTTTNTAQPPLPAVGEAATEAEVEAVARAWGLLAAGWTRPAPDGDAIERAAYVREHLADYLRDWRMAPCDHTIDMDREPCCAPCLRDRIIASGLLASPEPGRGEAELKAEGWDEAVRECHGLGWMHDFALSDALERNPYRAARSAGTTDTEGRTDHE